MNPRVKQLAEQAGGMVLAGSEIQKFAELIVRECADIACNHMELNEGTDFNVGEKIKQHFGVEE